MNYDPQQVAVERARMRDQTIRKHGAWRWLHGWDFHNLTELVSLSAKRARSRQTHPGKRR